MRIAIVRQRYNPFGGAERFVERALGALVEQGAEVTLITRNWDGAPQANFRQVTLDPPYSRILGGRAARDRRFASAVQAEFARGRYDITQSHERIPGCMIFRAGDGVHAAWLEHRAWGLGPAQRWAQRWSSYHRYVLEAEREMYAHPALRTVICNSRMVADEIVQYYGVDRAKLQVIYNGVDGGRFHPGLRLEYRDAMRRQLAIPDHAAVMLHVGSGFDRKGVPQLLDAWTQVKRPDAHLVVVGADRHLRRLRSRVIRSGLENRVHFAGGVTDVRPWYGLADVFVLNTQYDPCPNAVFEAMACGLPVLTTSACGAKEWIGERYPGCILTQPDTRRLAEAIEAMLDADSLARTSPGGDACPSLPSIGEMAGALLGLYRTLAGK